MIAQILMRKLLQKENIAQKIKQIPPILEVYMMMEKMKMKIREERKIPRMTNMF